ncbi:TRAP transporter small permease subunit [Oceanibaculum pacificum]|uniref:TRAP transporter small permease protein n=1 Tax=Oceanibaculum pacificum TaxID=580166 RepID=A0A154VUK6_9PROT|nr:TRAP transporter small permease [Oceanibaculum pacificum]KZD04861.1 C4-dicarboxylate ABC transporter substrate-binding protein [Oceanibaculum pacificum]
MDVYVRAVAALSRACGVAAALMILMAVLIVCQMIFVRTVLQESAIWQSEFVTFILVAATFMGSPYVLLTRGHVNVDLLPLYLPHKARIWLALLASSLALIFCAVLLWDSVVWWLEAYEGNWLTSSIWRARLWIYYAAMPIGFGVLTLQYIADIYCLATGRDMPFGMTPETRL